MFIFGCCHLFPPFWRSCFSFSHPLALSLVSLPFPTQVCQGRVSPDECPLSLRVEFYSNFLLQAYKFRYTIVSQRVSCQTHSLKARLWGEYHRKFPTFKKKRECACLQGFTVHGLLHTSYMAASVGPKAQ